MQPRRIIVGYDGSPPSQRALEWVLARAIQQDEVIVINAIPTGVAGSSLAGMMPAGLGLPPALDKTFEENARSRLEDVLRKYATSGPRIRGEVRPGDPADVFVAAVRELGAHEVVIGHKSYEEGAMKLGPIAERLVRHVPATVTVVR